MDTNEYTEICLNKANEIAESFKNFSTDEWKLYAIEVAKALWDQCSDDDEAVFIDMAFILCNAYSAYVMSKIDALGIELNVSDDVRIDVYCNQGLIEEIGSLMPHLPEELFKEDLPMPKNYQEILFGAHT